MTGVRLLRALAIVNLLILVGTVAFFVWVAFLTFRK